MAGDAAFPGPQEATIPFFSKGCEGWREPVDAVFDRDEGRRCSPVGERSMGNAEGGFRLGSGEVATLGWRRARSEPFGAGRGNLMLYNLWVYNPQVVLLWFLAWRLLIDNERSRSCDV